MPITFLTNCKKCKKEVFGYKRKDKKRSFCSLSCKSSFENKNRVFSEKTIKKMRKARLGVEPWNKGMKDQYGTSKKGTKLSIKQREKMSQSLKEAYRTGKRTCYQKDKPQLNRRGNKASNWQGGITSYDQTERTRVEFKMWRREVFKINSNKCAVCNNTKFLIAHHIKSFKDYPLLRYDPKNGIIVCRICHPSIHKYGLEYMQKMGKINLERNCTTCKKLFSFIFSRKEIARYCSKQCLYNRPNRVIFASNKLEYIKKYNKMKYQKLKNKKYDI